MYKEAEKRDRERMNEIEREFCIVMIVLLGSYLKAYKTLTIGIYINRFARLYSM